MTEELRTRIAELLVEFDGVESKTLAADEIVNRLVGPELERLRTELAAQIEASVRSDERTRDLIAERDALAARLDRAVVLPENWRDRLAVAFEDEDIEHIERLLRPALPAGTASAETPEPTPEPRPFTAASPVPDWPAAPEPTAEAEPACTRCGKTRTDHDDRGYCDLGPLGRELLARFKPASEPTEATTQLALTARAPRVFRAGDAEPPADVTVLRDDWPSPPGFSSFLCRALGGGWDWTGVEPKTPEKGRPWSGEVRWANGPLTEVVGEDGR